MNKTSKFTASPDKKPFWIQKAISKPGALSKQMGIPAGKKIGKKKLAKAAKSKGKLGKRSRLAQTLAQFHK